MRSGAYQHFTVTPSQIAGGSVGLDQLYPNMLSPDNADLLADGLDFEYEGAGMGENLGDSIPSLLTELLKNFIMLTVAILVTMKER